MRASPLERIEMPAYPYFVALHALLGTVSLITFWSAAGMKKGSQRHRTIGKIFLLAMCGVIVSGIPLVVEYVFFRQNLVSGAFLAYLLPLTAQACWLAWRAVTDKRDWRAMVARPAWRAWSWAAMGAGLGVLALGMVRGEPLFMGFSTIGLLLGVQMRQFARRGPKHANWHVIQHYQAMLGCGIATHVAFLGIAMRPVWAWLRTNAALPEQVAQLFPWFAPVAVAVLAGLWLDRKYARPRTRRDAPLSTPAFRSLP